VGRPRRARAPTSPTAHSRVSPKQFNSAGWPCRTLPCCSHMFCLIVCTHRFFDVLCDLFVHSYADPFLRRRQVSNTTTKHTTPQLTLPPFVPRHSLTYLTNRTPRPHHTNALTYANSSSACEECQHRERITTSSLERVIEDLLTCKQEVCLSHHSALYRTCPNSIFSSVAH
jgi:hypothetical protein